MYFDHLHRSPRTVPEANIRCHFSMSNKSRRENQQKAKIPHCSTCRRILKDERCVRCLRCPNFFQCLDCLSVGLRSQPHILDHNFIVFEPPGSSPLFRQGWDREEEILLLYGIKILGLGNWHEISKFMVTKTHEECEMHYIETYIKSTKAPLPKHEMLPELKKPPPLPYSTKPQDSIPSEGNAAHLKEKNKKEATTPAEYSEFMPYRHEFDKDKDFVHDGELLVAQISFNEAQETYESFNEKILQLKCYNKLLAERRFRTAVIEEFNIHYREYTGKNKIKSDEDFAAIVLNGITKEDKIMDLKLLTLAPYFGKEKILKLAENLHKRQNKIAAISNRYEWQTYGIYSQKEGSLFNKLKEMTKKDHKGALKIKSKNIENWNQEIHNFNATNSLEFKGGKEILLPGERELCEKHKIDLQLYLVFKNFIIREYTIYRSFPKSRIQTLPIKYHDQLEVIYDLCAKFGWIAASEF